MSDFDSFRLPSPPKEGAIVQMVVNCDGLKWRECGQFGRTTVGTGPTRNAIVIGTFIIGADNGWYIKCVVHKNPYGDQHLYLPRFAPELDANGKYKSLLLPVDMNWASTGTKQFKVLQQMVLHRSTCFDDTLPEDKLTIVKRGQMLVGHAVGGADDYNYLMTTVKNPAGGIVICFLPAQAKGDSSIKFAVQMVTKQVPVAKSSAPAARQPARQPARQAAPARKMPPPPPPPRSKWVMATTPEGEEYYYNTDTNETTWDKPPGMP